jgi:hypothetical protein
VPSCPPRTASFSNNTFFKKEQRNGRALTKKRARHQALLYQLCRPYFPENFDLILIGGATLLVRARAPPETWTTRLQSYDQPEPALVDYLFDLVIIFSNDCPKFEQSAKSLRFGYYELHSILRKRDAS